MNVGFREVDWGVGFERGVKSGFWGLGLRLGIREGLRYLAWGSERGR